MRIAQPLAFTEIGRRKENEDAIYPPLGMANNQDTLFMVCDGVGGLSNGYIASSTISKNIAYYLLYYEEHPFTEELFKKALACAWDELDRITRNDTGTTLTLLNILEDRVFIAHIGDSRVYHIRPKTEEILFQTKDHSLINEWIDNGNVQESDVRELQAFSHIMTRGIQNHRTERDEAYIYQTTDVCSGDYFFLCSDGVLEFVTNARLLYILCSDGSDTDKMNQIKTICDENSSDNYSAYLIRIL